MTEISDLDRAAVETLIADEIDKDFERLFERWREKGYATEFVVPTALVFAMHTAKHHGISFESAIETLQLIWHGTPS